MGTISLTKLLTPIITYIIGNYTKKDPRNISEEMESIKKTLLEEGKKITLLSERIEKIKDEIDTIKTMITLLVAANLLLLILTVSLLIN